MRGLFSIYLRRARLTLGPSSRCTRHSDLSTLKSFLLGERVTHGDTRYRAFGRAFHELFLLNKRGADWRKCTEDEQKRIVGMVNSLNRHPVVKKLMAHCTVRERRRHATLNNVRVGYTPDAHGTKICVDPKTTILTDQTTFATAALGYGYYRQGVQYSIALGLKEYWIIGIQKMPPYRVYLIPIFDDRPTTKYCEQELEFLLYFYKHYGNPNWKSINRAR